MTEQFEWPEDRTPVRRVRQWISDALGGGQDIRGPLSPLPRNDLRSASGVFEVNPAPEEANDPTDRRTSAIPKRQSERLFFKVGYLGEIEHSPAIHQFLASVAPGSVPSLVASTIQAEQTWMLFQYIDGMPLMSSDSFPLWLEVVTTLADVQVRSASGEATAPAGIRRLSVRAVLELLPGVRALIQDDFLPIWRAKWTEFVGALPALNQLDIDGVLPSIDHFTDQLGTWADELERQAWPMSITHFDLHVRNALRAYDPRRIVVVDWDGSAISCPFFSLERLMTEALYWDHPEQQVWTEPGEPLSPHMQMVCETYLDAIPWGDREERVRGLDLALCLSPIPLLEGRRRMTPPEYRVPEAFEAAAVALAATQRWRLMNETGRVLPRIHPV